MDKLGLMDAFELLKLDWASILQPIVGAGLGTALVQSLLTIYRDRRQRLTEAAYMAMRLAVTLESYTIACINLIKTNAYAQPYPDSELGHLTVDLPELPPYPADNEGWRVIDRKLAGRCLSLRNKIVTSDQAIKSIIDFDDRDLEEEVELKTASLGEEAWSIAASLRKKHGIEEADIGLDSSWLIGRIKKIEENRSKRSQKHS